MKILNKRGQVFLIATIIIVSIVIGLATAVNSTIVGNEQEQFYDLSKEIKFETKRVLDFGVINSRDTKNLMENFLNEYVSYISEEQVVFVFGNSGGLKAFVFENVGTGSVGLNTGEDITGTISVTIQEVEGITAEVNEAAGEVTVEINSIQYKFDLKEGQNFYFVLIKVEDDEKFVAEG